MLNDMKLTRDGLIQKISECKCVVMDAEQRMVYADSSQARQNDMNEIKFYRTRISVLSTLLEDLEQTHI